MSETKLNAIPRPASKPPPTPSLDEWVVGAEPSPAAAPRRVTIKAAVSPELRRRLRMAAAAQDKNVADILRELAERWLDEQGY